MSSNIMNGRFVTIKNGIDERLEIILDTETGFYNMTKTAKAIGEMMKSDNIIGYDSNKIARPYKWFENSTTTELIEACKKLNKLDKLVDRLSAGIPMEYSGTYIHRDLFDHFLIWLGPTYALKVSKILDKVHQDANRKLLQEKDDAINRLSDIVKDQSIQLKDQSEQIKELLFNSKLTIEKLNETHSELTETRSELTEARLDIQDGNNQIERLSDKVEECRDVIIDRMEEHTINPKSITKRQYFTCLQNPVHLNELYVIRSQKSNIKKQIAAHVRWNVLIEPIEDPNSIKMFNRFKERVRTIERDWKTEIKMQYKKKEISLEDRDGKLQFIIDNPLISITRNDIVFDSDRISIEEILKLMRDTTFDRFNLSVP